MRKSRNIEFFFQLLSLIIALIGGLQTQAFSQGICIPNPLTTTRISGRVVAELNRGETPIINSSVEVLEDRNRGRLISKVTANEKGEFNFDQLKPGKYILKISSPNLASFFIRVRLIQVKTIKARLLPNEIIIYMGADGNHPCNGSRAEIRARKKA